MSLDTIAIPKDAPHPDEAYVFIDFLLRPDSRRAQHQCDEFRQWRRRVKDRCLARHSRTTRRSIPTEAMMSGSSL